MTTNVLTPPQLHWALVLLLSVLTLGIFYIVWMFVQSRWAARIDPESPATWQLAVYTVLAVAGQVVLELSDKESGAAVAGVLLILLGTAVGIVAYFSIRRTMLDHYASQPGASLPRSSALTFFLGPFYMQHHMTRNARRA